VLLVDKKTLGGIDRCWAVEMPLMLWGMVMLLPVVGVVDSKHQRGLEP
jgi:hypothetical protein